MVSVSVRVHVSVCVSVYVHVTVSVSVYVSVSVCVSVSVSVSVRVCLCAPVTTAQTYATTTGDSICPGETEGSNRQTGNQSMMTSARARARTRPPHLRATHRRRLAAPPPP